jgi:hypothetical protein
MVRLIIFLLLTCSITIAQPGERLEALRTSFITTELDLTPEQAQQFWPIYNQHQQKMQELREEEIQLLKNIRKNLADSDEQEAERMLDQFLDIEQRKGNLDASSVYKDLVAVIGAKKVLMLKRAEFQFKQRLLRELSERRGKRGRPRE